MEDYKEKYEQLTKFIIDLSPSMTIYCKKRIEEFLSTPKESEDERKRKALIQHIKYKVSVIQGWRKEELIAWLEKQGEQKPAWSEEDDEMFYRVIQTEESCIDDCDVDDVGIKARFCYEKEIGWLESIKKRMKGGNK